MKPINAILKAHTSLGWITAFLSLLALITAAFGGRELRASGLLFAAVAVQVLLGVLGENSSAWFGAVHGLNALVVMGAAVNLARRTAPTSGHGLGARARPGSPDPSPPSTRTPSP
jgi:heme A synthase